MLFVNLTLSRSFVLNIYIIISRRLKLKRPESALWTKAFGVDRVILFTLFTVQDVSHILWCGILSGQAETEGATSYVCETFDTVNMTLYHNKNLHYEIRQLINTDLTTSQDDLEFSSREDKQN